MSKYLARLAFLPRRAKIIVLMFADLILLPLALWSSIALRMGSLHPEVNEFWWLFFVVPVLTVPIFVRLGLYRAVIRYLDLEIVKTIFYGVSLSVFLLIVLLLMTKSISFPRSSIIIYGLISVGYIASSRYLARGVLRSVEYRQKRKQHVAIYGAGRAGLQTALALISGPEYNPILFFDDNKDMHGRLVAGIRVHNPENALELMDKNDCYQLLLAIPSASRMRRKEIIQRFKGQNIQLKTIPGFGELVNGTVLIDEIREVGIEDLLGRDPVPPFQDLISSCITGKSVLVTGAGGSIGSELCRQILNNHPQKLVLFERSEFALYKIEQELKRSALTNDAKIVHVLADIHDDAFFESVLAKHRVETVYHAAAYKHVPLVEENIVPSVLNNVFGTLKVALASQRQKVKTFVLVSTDKAVRPTNVMGATKRMAELILQSLAEKKSHTLFCMVRFGNVLGSSGSVVPLFKEQIKNGGPVTVTDANVTRYFMTIAEASQLVIQAGAMGVGGDVFVLDMGEAVKIYDLAKKMIELSGFEVYDNETGKGDVAIEFSGLRSGEKLYEELLIGSNVSQTLHPRVMRAQEDFLSWSELDVYLQSLKSYCELGKTSEVYTLLQQVVKEFKPSNIYDHALDN